MDMRTCDVVIPCRDEALALPQVLADVPDGWHVIVVDNGGYQEIKQNEIDAGIAPVAVDLVQPDWVAPGATVIDVGITRVLVEETGKYKLRGDVDPAVAQVAGALSPVPGGVGPMTRAMLLKNVVEAAERDA